MEPSILPRRSSQPNKGKPSDILGYLANENRNDSENYKEALSRSGKNKWFEAIEEEMKSLYNNHTLGLVKLPKGNKPVGCKWTFQIIFDQDGNIMQCRARLVAKGYNQKFEIDYDETFAPVAKHTTIRAFLTFAVYKTMHVKHIDVKKAFLPRDLHEEK
ncbi:retrovirus-related Pol polyprotein from transposon TNT 1-94 [Nephila pilipes]|uniref:Retrovirus-related Pol polyprotein from transposon TNT 1-94 n=1 Tax=Nephila pilipes TaxID=299642 RepID=A0A8X6MHX4_NEPPI|nr:retrovirus-related Pol polyprotein from transposon TNT 1-94 [Nephila pilipes]